MAFQSNGPVMLALPPFRGFTRKLILTTACAWLLELLLVSAMGRYSAWFSYLALQPNALVHGMVWQAGSYPAVEIGMGLIGMLFALVTIWFFGSRVEDDRGSRWFVEFLFVATIGGSVVATMICYGADRWIHALTPANLFPAAGLWPAVMAIVVAFAYFYGEEPIRLYFVLNVKAKYVAALYLGYYVLALIFSGDRFGPLVVLANALCGWLFLKYVPRRGLLYAASERWYGLRNDRLRAKRKRAAKEFEVYMRKQGRDVRVDDSSSDDKKWKN